MRLFTVILAHLSKKAFNAPALEPAPQVVSRLRDFRGDRPLGGWLVVVRLTGKRPIRGSDRQHSERMVAHSEVAFV
jgi:hypothetical protein